MNLHKKLLLTLTIVLGTAAVDGLAQQQVLTDPPSTPPLNTPVFLWHPVSNSVQVGEATTSWSTPGDYSFSLGLDAEAEGDNSFAFGSSASANGNGNFVFGDSWTNAANRNFVFGDNSYTYYSTGNFIFGDGITAVGPNGSFIFGNGASASSYAFVFGQNADAGSNGIALGDSSYASNYGIALGASSNAAASNSVAIGRGGNAAGLDSVAIGKDSMTSADSSFAAGDYTLTTAFGSVAIGTGNESKMKDGSTPNPASQDSSDPLLMVGNGSTSSGGSNRSNALTVYRDGDAHFTGAVRVPEQGDIGMGDFTSTPSGVQFP